MSLSDLGIVRPQPSPIPPHSKSATAIASLASGIFAWVLLFLIIAALRWAAPVFIIFGFLLLLPMLLSGLAAIAAIVLGYVASRKIRHSPGKLSGNRLAMTGLWLGVGFFVFVMCAPLWGSYISYGILR